MAEAIDEMGLSKVVEGNATSNITISPTATGSSHPLLRIQMSALDATLAENGPPNSGKPLSDKGRARRKKARKAARDSRRRKLHSARHSAQHLVDGVADLSVRGIPQ